MKLYEDLYTNKESPMSILFMFSRHINILLQVKECKNRGLRSGEIAKNVGFLRLQFLSMKNRRHFSNAVNYWRCCKPDWSWKSSLKSGKLSDQLAVELFLIEALNGE